MIARFVAAALAGAAVVVAWGTPVVEPVTAATAVPSGIHLPLFFERNDGQFAAGVRFAAGASG